MKKLWMALPLMLGLSAPAAFAGNIANCEVVLMEPMIQDGEDTGGRFASFRPAAQFMSSVYDDADGFEGQLEGHDIRGVMCTRREIIPTLRDFPVIATGIPFSVSENFDAADSNLITLYFKEGKFHYNYTGIELTAAEQDELLNVMDVFNLQPHSLGKNKKQ